MLEKGLRENRQHGTDDFPLEYYQVDYTYPRYIMPHHCHDEIELIHIQKGAFRLSLNGKEYTLNEGDLCYISSGSLHGGTPQDCVYECLCFNSTALLSHSNLVWNYLKDVEDGHTLIQPVFNKMYPGILKCASRMFAAIRSKKPGWELLALSGLYDFYGTVIQQDYRESPLDSTAFQRLRQIKLSLEYIEQNYQKPISLERLADVSGLSAKYFCRYFRSILQRTPIDYLNHYRIERACLLLEDNRLSVTDVACACGYNDSSYFVRSFKKYKGVTPNQYAQMSQFQQING
jgi:AraC-like DNA-binding protein